MTVSSGDEILQAMNPDTGWPDLPLAAWEDTRDTFHLWTQVVGKIRLALEPMVNHWWQTTLYVSARGLTSSLMHAGPIGLEIADDHHLVREAIARAALLTSSTCGPCSHSRTAAAALRRTRSLRLSSLPRIDAACSRTATVAVTLLLAGTATSRPAPTSIATFAIKRVPVVSGFATGACGVGAGIVTGVVGLEETPAAFTALQTDKRQIKILVKPGA